MDTIVNDRNTVARIQMGVSIFLAGPAVGCPTRVSHPDMPARGRGCKRRLETNHLPDRPAKMQLSLINGGNSRGIVAAVFQTLESVQQDRLSIPFADISNDSAHRRLALGSGNFGPISLIFFASSWLRFWGYSLKTLPTVRSRPPVAFRVSKMLFAWSIIH